ncbi:hypothetical protein LCGC14_0397030 [marine sediment metagenome]|uniref:Uncharacterized protein n=1 Tax=marine sediment metagenome TaxID=412755 RepID=A0A0F9SXV6_9ZZZZ
MTLNRDIAKIIGDGMEELFEEVDSVEDCQSWINERSAEVVGLLRQGPTVTVAGDRWSQNFMLTTLEMTVNDARGTYALVLLEEEA